jgi:DNA-binding XRE family transcriptional regulator
MRPEDLTRWRNALGVTKTEAAAICGRERNWLWKIEDGQRPIPRWLNYLVAWTRLYGTRLPFEAEELPNKIREMRKRWYITQEEMGMLLDMSRDVIIAAEKGRPLPIGVAFALSWIDFYGSRLPFPSLVGIPPCPHCGKKISL